jgi:hypothetical protein
MLVSLLKPLTIRAGRQLAERRLDPDGPSFVDGLRKARARQSTPDDTNGDRPA